MAVQNLEIPDAFVVKPDVFSDDRGIFYEWFQNDLYKTNTFNLAQANISISKKGSLRGIHFAMLPPGQRKHVTCLNGSALDVLVDLRKGSPMFGKWVAVPLNGETRNIVSIPNGVGHAFIALEDNTLITYLCDQRYNPENEKELNPLDPELGIEWPVIGEIHLSHKDKLAPLFKDAMHLFPEYERLNTENF